VTGANRGLGLETCRRLARLGHTVIVTSRDEAKGHTAVRELSQSGLTVTHHQLDVTKSQSIQRVRSVVEETFGRLDILVNNAGVFLDTTEATDRATVLAMTSPLHTRKETLVATFETNTLGPFFMCQHFIPMMMKNNYGRVVNVTSQMGQLSSMGSGWTAYRISKTALNAVTRIFAQETAGKNILVNSVHPGWVQKIWGARLRHCALRKGAKPLSGPPRSQPVGLWASF